MRSTQILPGDPAYPPSLNVLAPLAAGGDARAPPALYVRGELPRAPGVAVVGTRDATDEALRFARDLARDLATSGYCVWSGGALGIDAAAHEAALDAGGITVVVMGGGLDRPYPSEHRGLFARVLDRGGALVSQFADDVNPAPHRFHQRNAILAAATAATVVVQAGHKSGARNTAAHARRLARPLFAVPHAPWDTRGAGCALELVLGARAITCAADLIGALRSGVDAPLPPLSRARRRKPAVRACKGKRGAQLGLPNEDPSERSQDGYADDPPAIGRGEEISGGACLSSAGSVGPAVDSAGVADTNVGAGEPVDILLKALRSDPLHVDELCDASSLPLRLVVELLLTLTLQTVVVEGPAGFFRRVRH